ncbi:hypothetical protein PSTT_05949 [Puccinia striiformis]|uniref:SAPS domain-containing protein n=1 Tax=Puccinia striiformis TaxID=27350 RepID=A0A2S4VLY9_9BASI|nr:hypothetical protein PSTT_05949 [Puccinia striiformis]
MAFWKFGFHSQSAIDSILSSSAANQQYANPNAGCSTPSFSSPSILLDKLLEEDDLLQEIKAQHPKLVEFLGTREVVSRILGYVSGLTFDDQEADRLAEHSDSPINRLSSARPSANTSPTNPSSSTAVMGYGGALLNSFRSRVVGDTIGALLMDALDSEGRTPEDRAKDERRKIRYPYLCTEILAADLWSVTSQIFSDFPRLNLLTRFWDAVLDQPPSATSSKSVQIGYWAKANITLINSKPNEMMTFIRSYPNLIPKLLAHFNSSPIVDVLMRIIQSEQTTDGTIDWLIDSTDFVELIISLLHPSRSPDLHRSVSEFLKDVIAFCTNQVVSASPPLNNNNPPPAKLSTPSSTENTANSSPDLSRPAPSTTNNIGSSHHQHQGDEPEDHPKFITTRLMRELSSSTVISKLLSFGLDTPISEDDDVITNATLASSLINSLSVVIDLIRRNNSDYSEHQLMVYLRDYPPPPKPELESDQPIKDDKKPISEKAPRVVPLTGLLNSIGDRLEDLQKLIKNPRSSIQPINTVVGLSIPLTQERFRLIELYAELLHCSNMALVNRIESDSELNPIYNSDGALVDGLDALVNIFGSAVTSTLNDLDQSSKPSDDDDDDVTDSDQVIITQNESTPITQEKESIELETTSSSTTNNSSSLSDITKRGESTSSLSSKKEDDRDLIIPAGVRMKSLFLKHKVLDSCFDLFFEFPWNNFLHNVIYDLVQQTLNAKFSIISDNINSSNSSSSNSGKGNENSSALASLKLAQSFFHDTKIVDRLLDGVDFNQLYQMDKKNGRLGNMGHLILIGDEVLKAIENNPTEFESIIEGLEKNERWKNFINGPIDEAREHAKLPLGGVMPVISTGINLDPNSSTLVPGATDEIEEKLITEISTVATASNNNHDQQNNGESPNSISLDGIALSSATSTGGSSSTGPQRRRNDDQQQLKKRKKKKKKKGEGFARYLVEQISVVRTGADENSASSSSSSSSPSSSSDQEGTEEEEEEDDDDDESTSKGTGPSHPTIVPPPGGSSSHKPQPVHHHHFSSDYDPRDEWDSTRASDPSSFRSNPNNHHHQPDLFNSSGSDFASSSSSGYINHNHSVISNPSTFGFDNRVDLSNRSFPKRFEDSDLNDNNDDPGGFDDDFGALQEAEVKTPKPGSTLTTKGTPRPTKNPSSDPRTDKEQPTVIERGQANDDDDDEWGEFTGPTPSITLTTHTDEDTLEENLQPDLDKVDEDKWNDFDLLVDQTISLSINHPASSDPDPDPSS